MPAPSFGYSAGDFIATIQLIVKVISAFKDADGASAEYRQVVQQLESLNQVLQHLDTIQSTESNFAHVNAIKCVALSCQVSLQEFLDKVTEKYGPSLGGGQKKPPGVFEVTARLGSVRVAAVNAGRKTQWALVMGKDIVKLREAIQTNISVIVVLLGVNDL